MDRIAISNLAFVDMITLLQLVYGHLTRTRFRPILGHVVPFGRATRPRTP
jgi:hypothetical protein